MVPWKKNKTDNTEADLEFHVYLDSITNLDSKPGMKYGVSWHNVNKGGSGKLDPRPVSATGVAEFQETFVFSSSTSSKGVLLCLNCSSCVSVCSLAIDIIDLLVTLPRPSTIHQPLITWRHFELFHLCAFTGDNYARRVTVMLVLSRAVVVNGRNAICDVRSDEAYLYPTLETDLSILGEISKKCDTGQEDEV